MLRAIVVGGSRGIGFEIAKKFMKNAYNVTLISKTEDNLRESSKFLNELASSKRLNVSVDYKICDISDPKDIHQTCEQINIELTSSKEKIDVLVNSAGITSNNLLISNSLDEIQAIMATNLIGPILMVKGFYKQMIRQKKGSIINIGSIVGFNGNIGQTIYSTSKSGLVGFTKSLAKELGPKNITVNLICPGFIETDMLANTLSSENIRKYQERIPLKRFGTVKEVANAAYFLSTSRSFITGSILSLMVDYL
ncbi:3-oxoacyl-[acyl-carrier-protein] reductase FabG [Sarcoptes scabiei]|uniref:3-oxoacyl-[acyl-carrier-protein] reductase n=1 Tax=Sarcoptes scabiei TaxID=52283 RepID=A0A834R1L7_SARSC|nr:3-oxoacyl-[acyl-carrier-protein] reductase FabG [Sarcoptes scabiei]